MIHILLLVVFLICALPKTATAGYLDPGSGSTLAQGIAAFIASISRFFRKLFGRKN